MKGNIVFYCKGCGKMFYAGSQEHMDDESIADVAKYLSEGHRMETVDTATVRRDFAGCECK
jgi:hypothetical protein